jgi:hypothetical protein
MKAHHTVRDPSTFYERSIRIDSGGRIDQLIAAPDQMHFIGEQDGPAEQQLKRRLVQLFDSQETIDLAYLAMIQYSDEDTYSVALCVRSSSSDAATERAACDAGDVFFKLFGRGQRLDIIILNDEHWRELRAVCKPFYIRPAERTQTRF